MTYQEYIDKFKTFADKAVNEHSPTSDQSLSPGTINQVASYFEDFEREIKVLHSILIDKANELLNEANNDSSIDTAKLKDELYAMCKQSIQQLISK